ncbi:hypothetical protein SRABI70_03080 [Pseudomonas sp. Bi70]|nr:hypothetical protein SRABI70_03080 [Pseudomonas sp. Bi70]
MRNNQPITGNERTFPAQQRLISTTDLKGQITYCNDAFIEIRTCRPPCSHICGKP